MERLKLRAGKPVSSLALQSLAHLYPSKVSALAERSVQLGGHKVPWSVQFGGHKAP